MYLDIDDCNVTSTMLCCRTAVVLCAVVAAVAGMDYGGTGVWDSPMATDYWVKRFGFMWGGGSSGMYGLKALQVPPTCQ